jgi:hypothetical protein
VPDNDDVKSFNCVDTHKTKKVTYQGFTFDVHVCELLKNATADPGTGDYLQYEYKDDTSGGDAFAELSIFHHATKGYEYFRSLSPGFKLAGAAYPLFAVANLMLPKGLMTLNLQQMSDPNLPLDPFQNAFYTGWDPGGWGTAMSTVFPEITGAALFFGQGFKADYAYDGDVVYHELGHAVVDSTIALAGVWHLDAQGVTVSPGAMNEALADFFSSAITGDGDSGEYAAKDMGGASAIRHLDNTKNCPDWLTGEVHADSEFFSAALWKVRQAQASLADKRAFEQALLALLMASKAGDIAYEDLASAFVAALESSSLGKTVADAMKAEFTARGLLPVCKRMLEFKGIPVNSKDGHLLFTFTAASRGDLGLGGGSLAFAPGLFQLRVPVAAGTTRLKASFVETPVAATDPFSTGGTFTPAFLVGFDTAIAFDPKDGFKANTTTVADAVKSGTTYSASVDVPAGAQTAYVMVVNKGNKGAYYKTLNVVPDTPADAGTDGAADAAGDAADDTAADTVDSSPTPDTGGDAGAAADAGLDAGAAPPAEAPPPAEDTGGCGCRAPARHDLSAGHALALLAAAGAWTMARRRRGGVRRA